VRIEQSQIALMSHRVARVTDESSSTLKAWVGPKPAAASAGAASVAGAAAAAANASTVRGIGVSALASIVKLSADALAAASQTSARVAAGTASGAPDPNDPTTTDPNLAALIMLIERLTGHKVHLIHLVPSDANATAQQAATAATAGSAGATKPQDAGWGVEATLVQVHSESETTSFAAAGQVVTADGRTISLDYALAMHRDETQTSTVEIQAGNAVKVDPIALNLSGGPVQLSADRSAFDIDSDGKTEQVALPAAGTYFLALDRNGNGKIDSGSELFGPATGNGFAELRALDTDGNGWVDEGDAAYANLQLWSGSDSGLHSLAASGVGALYVARSAATQFDVKDAQNQTLGQVVSSSLYLMQDGTPGALQQVDLTA
jgi:hypothetical protein